MAVAARPPQPARRTWRLLIGAYLAVLALIAVAVLPTLVATIHTLDHQDSQYDPASAAASLLLVGALNEETGQRGYALTGDASFLQPYQLGATQYASAAASLDQLDLGPRYQADLAATEMAFSRWHQVVATILAGTRPGAPATPAAVAQQTEAKDRFDQFRSEQQALATTVEHTIRQNRASLHRGVVMSLIILAGALVLGLALGGAMLLWWRTSGRRGAEAEQELARRALMMQAAIDASSDSIFVKDLSGRHILANRARSYSVSGGDESVDVVGHPVDEFVAPEVAALIRRNESEVIATGQARQFEEVLPVHGQARHYAVTKNPLRDTDGRITGIVGVARDVTDELARLAELERLYAVEREIAQRLQDSMLGNTKVDEDRLEVCAYYRAAAEETSIGGDWYDVVPLGDDRIGLFIGDTVGHGLEAITAMGQLRSALSALAYAGAPPGETLETLERFALTVPDALTATCLYVRVDLAQRVLEYSCAGHMPMMVLRPGSPPELLDGAQDPPLAVGTSPRRRTTRVALEAGTIIVLFTDGLVERKQEGLDAGFDRLRAVVECHAESSMDDFCAKLVNDLVPAGVQRDDVAVVSARLL